MKRHTTVAGSLGSTATTKGPTANAMSHARVGVAVIIIGRFFFKKNYFKKFQVK